MVTLKELSDRITVETRSLLNRVTKNKKDADTKFTAVNTRVDTTNTRIDTTNTTVSGLSSSLGLVDDRLVIVENSLLPKPWSTWEPTFPSIGGMTFTSVTIYYAKYEVVGKTCHFALRATGTVGGTLDASLAFTLPKTAALGMYSVIGTVLTADGTLPNIGTMFLQSNTTALVRKQLNEVGSQPSWSAGGGRQIYASGTYEIR